MSKPYGLTASLQMVVPSSAQNEIYKAVQEAISCNLTPKQFMAEARECWEILLRDGVKEADDEFKRMQP